MAAVVRKERRTQAEPVDTDLLEKLGVDDPRFVEWLNALDTTPLLETALARTQGSAAFRIEGGMLVGPADGAAIEQRWQLEVLRVVLELLDYETFIDNGVLEGEKRSGKGVNEFVRVTSGRELRFEHFASDQELASEQRRFLALAQKLSLRLRLEGEQRRGQPIPKGAVHPHKQKGKG